MILRVGRKWSLFSVQSRTFFSLTSIFASESRESDRFRVNWALKYLSIIEVFVAYTSFKSRDTSHKNTRNFGSRDECDIRDLIDGLSSSLASRNFDISGYTSVSLAAYQDASRETRKRIFDSISSIYNLVSQAPKELRDLELDKFMFKNACRGLDLTPSDDFIASLKGGEIIEVYELETQTQVYRNLEFLRHCSYDLLTVCIVPYPELFERETGFLEKIMERTKHVTNMADQMESWNVPDHELVERLHSNRRRFKLTLGNIAPVLNSKTKKRVAWASTIRAVCVGSIYQNLSNVVPF